MRKAGILMPVASLPGPHGVGDFGKEAYRFVDMITEVVSSCGRYFHLIL